MNCTPSLVASAMLLAGAASTSHAFASSSGLDTTFGNNGTLAISEIEPQGEVNVALDTKGNILVAGESANPSGMSFLLRVTSSGALDTSFASIGFEYLSLGTIDSIAVLANDQILVAGVTLSGEALVQRYNTNGTLDTTFGSGGSTVATTVGAAVIVVQPNGSIVVGGAAGPALATERFLADGAIDTSFGTAGTAESTVGGSVTCLGLEPDGTILALDGSELGEPGVTPIVSFTADGTPEAATVTGTVSPIAVSNTAAAATLRPAGDAILGARVTGVGKEGRFGEIQRYTLQGVRDTTFDTPFNWGAALPNVQNVPFTVGLEAGGQIVAAGIANLSSTEFVFGFGEFNSNGTPDTAFADGGLTNTEIVGSDEAFNLAVQSNGMVVVVGSESLANGGQDQLVLARYVAP